jgi:plasmid stability protein
MERINFEIERRDVTDALRAEASAHGRSVTDEVAALVERTYAGKAPKQVPQQASAKEGDWVTELLELGKKIGLENGIETFIPKRLAENYAPPKL